MDLILFGNAREKHCPGRNGSDSVGASSRYSTWLEAVWGFPQVSELWAHVDLNHGPHPYQG